MPMMCAAYSLVPKLATIIAYMRNPPRMHNCSNRADFPTFEIAMSADLSKRHLSCRDKRRNAVWRWVWNREYTLNTKPTHSPIAVATAAPLTPQRGNGPMPLIKSQLKSTFTALEITLTYIVNLVFPTPRCAAQMHIDSAFAGSAGR